MGASCCSPTVVLGQNTLAAEQHHAQPNALLFSSPHGVFSKVSPFLQLRMDPGSHVNPSLGPHCIPMGATASIPRSQHVPALCQPHSGVHRALSRTSLPCSTALHPQPLSTAISQRLLS